MSNRLESSFGESTYEMVDSKITKKFFMEKFEDFSRKTFENKLIRRSVYFLACVLLVVKILLEAKIIHF